MNNIFEAEKVKKNVFSLNFYLILHKNKQILEIHRNEECRFYLNQNLFQFCPSKNLKICPLLSISSKTD
jgi:hypothetical protein